ncbi:transposase [Streptomyces violens]|uniref:transposase n=1 Tax=Streptomyces violens TaxID=66377 RepID=UPI001FE1D709|nr:transposase [Streptomyces violens]
MLEPLLPRGEKPGRPPTWMKRQLIGGIRFRTRTGVPWRDVPERYGHPGGGIGRRMTRVVIGSRAPGACNVSSRFFPSRSGGLLDLQTAWCATHWCPRCGQRCEVRTVLGRIVGPPRAGSEVFAHAADERSYRLEVAQLVGGEGPCTDAYLQRRSVETDVQQAPDSGSSLRRRPASSASARRWRCRC